MTVMKIGADHFIEGVRRDLIVGGASMLVRRALVIHFTAGASGASSIAAMRERGVSAHLVIERDGTVVQCRAFNVTADHAGTSRWREPSSGTKFTGLNSCSIGIEIANAGGDAGALAWARKQPGFASIRARHRNGGPEQEWEAFSTAQLAAVFEAARALVLRYRLDDITGHDCIAPERKADPGPAFPMQLLREHCGFTGLPAVHRT
jgi:N-acetylmuramoyl-L-alanine amidase